MNRRDLEFLLFDWLKLEDLLGASHFADIERGDVQQMLDLAQSIAEEQLAPHMQEGDKTEPCLDQDGSVRMSPVIAEDLRLLVDTGLFGAVFETELGGLQLPNLVHMAAMGLLMGGNISVASFMLLTVANARLIANHGTEGQIAQFARPQIDGTVFGTMCLSEPHAGSSLGDITTKAVPDGADELGRRYRVTGNKMWISAADHDITRDIVHLVLAKVPDSLGHLPGGSRGISLFVVPKYLPNGTRNDVQVAGLNHKMGYRGIPNCALNFGEGREQPGGKSGALGWLVGELGQGLPIMFQMMNEARIAVGLGGAMLAYRAYLSSLHYAREREQGRLTGIKSGPPVAIAEHADVKRMLLAQKSYAEGALALVLYSAKLLDETHTLPDAAERRRAEELLSLLTPVTKSWPAEWGQQSIDAAIQVLGGAGYTRDFPIEQLYRDNRLNAIHEGTTGIQALDLLLRKIKADQGGAYQLLRSRVRATTSAPLSEPMFGAAAGSVDAAWCEIDRAIEQLLTVDAAEAAIHAAPTLTALGHAVVGWLWLDKIAGLCALPEPEGEAERAYRRGKMLGCRYFSEYELPKIAGWLAPVFARSDVTTSIAIEEFLGEVA